MLVDQHVQYFCNYNSYLGYAVFTIGQLELLIVWPLTIDSNYQSTIGCGQN